MSKHLTLFDFRDVDLMQKVAAEGGAGGLSSRELADSLGMGEDIAAVAIRCAWMRRYGFFDFDEEHRLWTLSKGGERIVEANVRASTIAKVEQVPDEALVDVMAHVTSRYRHGDPLTANLLRREFAYGTSPRSTVYSQNGTGRRR